MAAGRARGSRPRRVSLPGVAELLRPVGPGPASDSGRQASGREAHPQKITVYLSADELLDLERVRLALRAHGIGVDRGRLVREAIAVLMMDLEAGIDASVIVRRLSAAARPGPADTAPATASGVLANRTRAALAAAAFANGARVDSAPASSAMAGGALAGGVLGNGALVSDVPGIGGPVVDALAGVALGIGDSVADALADGALADNGQVADALTNGALTNGALADGVLADGGQLTGALADGGLVAGASAGA